MLDLQGASGETAIAEQDVTITEIGTEHVLRFRVRGMTSDTVKLRIGTASGAADIVNDRQVAPGWHAVAFTPTVGTVYIQFRNENAKSIYIDDVDLLDNAAVEIATPYTEAELSAIKYAQSADVLYVAHPSHATMKLERRGHTDWALVEVDWQDGPYLDENTTATTLAASATSGLGITITASAVTDINDGAGFKASDVAGWCASRTPPTSPATPSLPPSRRPPW